jgi:hypothetical protein
VPPSLVDFEPASVTVVPDPTSVALFGLGAATLFAISARRRKAATSQAA